MSRTGREWRLVSRPCGLPRESDFRLEQVSIPDPGDGELVVRNAWMSLDPSMRIRMHERDSVYMPRFELGRPMDGWAVGEVIASATDEFAAGDWVLHPQGWREYALLRVGGRGRTAPTRIEVDETTPPRAYLGPLGWVGLTSYVGLLEIAELRDGDVVFVSGAAGAVGSLAVQIAKLRQHVVIGSAGSAEKVRFVREELGADAVFCYRDGDIGDLLRAAAPDGIDVYFDNVGGDHLQAALDALRPRGRVALCGAISTYNAGEPQPGPTNLFNAVAKGLTLRGFLARMYADRMEEFRGDMRRWLAAGQIVYPETVFNGLEEAPRGIIALLSGANVGKVLVKIG
jgi:NADPH-dependent curcumin reductase CurA